MTEIDEDGNQEKLRLPCLKVDQPLGTFYVTVMSALNAFRLSYSDVRRIASEKRAVETYLGIERPLDKKRVAELREYVRTSDASFPSAVVFAVSSDDAEYHEDSHELSLLNQPDIAKILDGQHRLAGLDGYDGPAFDVIVTVFIDIDIEDQALLFATINLEQSKVNRSLAYDLFGYAKTSSPQRTAHNIVVLLDSESGSPFEGKIKRLGFAEDAGETISQAVFVEALLRMISTNPMKDRDLLRRGLTPEPATLADEKRGLVFRNFFLGKHDEVIADQLWRFFDAVSERWPDAWNEVRRGFILNRTTGFRALTRFLPYAYREGRSDDELPTKAHYAKILQGVRLEDGDLTSDEFKPGTGGESSLRRRLLADTGLQ